MKQSTWLMLTLFANMNSEIPRFNADFYNTPIEIKRKT